jgi:hypothetical protein
MPAYSLRIGEIAKQQQAPPRESMSRGKIMLNPNVENIPLMMFDIYELTGQRTFIWDFEDNGWSQGYWAGYTELAVMFLYEDIILRAGHGEAVYTRAGTTTRLAEDGDTDTVAANKPPFDWLVGPNGIERYAYNPDKAGSSLILPLSQNIYRKEGSVSCWIRPSVAGSVSEVSDRVIFGSSTLKLYKKSGTTDLWFHTERIDGTNLDVTHDISDWTADSWHFICVTWDKTLGQISIRDEDLLVTTGTSTIVRFKELEDEIGIGCLDDGTDIFNGYIADFRIWPQVITSAAFEAMYRVGA